MTVINLSLTMLLAFNANYAFSDNLQETGAASPAVAELIALEEAWIAAEVNGDRAALERILHENFVVTYPSGQTVDRSTFIDGILKSRPAPFTVTHEFIRVYGDTAVIIDVSRDLSESDEFKFTWIAVRRDKQWRVISETVSNVESD